MQHSKTEAKKDGQHVPTTLEEYCVTAKPKPRSTSSFDASDMADFYEDDYRDDDGCDDAICDDDEDSGHGDF